MIEERSLKCVIPRQSSWINLGILSALCCLAVCILPCCIIVMVMIFEREQISIKGTRERKRKMFFLLSWKCGPRMVGHSPIFLNDMICPFIDPLWQYHFKTWQGHSIFASNVSVICMKPSEGIDDDHNIEVCHFYSLISHT